MPGRSGISPPKRVTINSHEEVVVFRKQSTSCVHLPESGTEDEEPPSTPVMQVDSQRRHIELIRLESLVRCHVQHQWHLSMENYRCEFKIQGPP